MAEGAPKAVAFQGDDQTGCPDAKNSKCNTGVTVAPKDAVLVSESRGGFRCAWFQPARKGATGTWGWLPDNMITLQPDAGSALDPWITRFEQGGEWIAFKKVDGQLVGEGSASWLSKSSAGGSALPGKIAVKGRVLTYTDDSCMVLMVLTGDAVLASATGKCPGGKASVSTVLERAR